jgi:hypothetical protein
MDKIKINVSLHKFCFLNSSAEVRIFKIVGWLFVTATSSSSSDSVTPYVGKNDVRSPPLKNQLLKGLECSRSVQDGSMS